MKNEKDKKLDDLFKKRLEDPGEQSGYREEDWDALEDMLDKRKRRTGIVYLLPILSSVAAVMLVFLGWWVFQPKNNHAYNTKKPQIAAVIQPKTNNTTTANTAAKTITKEEEQQSTQSSKQNIQPKAGYLATVSKSKPAVGTGNVSTNTSSLMNNSAIDSLNNKASIFASAKNNKANSAKDSAIDNSFARNHPLYTGTLPLINKATNVSNWRKNGQFDNLNDVNAPVNTKLNSASFANNNKIRDNITPISAAHPIFNLSGSANNNTAQKLPPVNSKVVEQPATAAEKSNAAMMKLLESTSAPASKLSAKTQAAFKPHFVGGIIGASDVSGAGSFKQAKVGSKAGLVFAAGVSQKFTISTGAVYSSTPYSAGYDSFSLPYQPKVAPTSMSANCQMLDIPINIGYKVFNQGRNIISVGTGLSSYIMLQQDYNFVYTGTSGTTSRDYSVPNSASYLFKILNLNATYERQISSRAGITVQPYLKLPLADIGYSQVKLQTTGVAVGLSWNLDSSQP